jgi:hypothetical protein
MLHNTAVAAVAIYVRSDRARSRGRDLRTAEISESAN